MTQIRSDSVIASSWSWVTKTLVVPSAQVEVLDLGAHPGAERGVEVAERLVEKEDERLLDQRPPERDALLLAARQLGRLAVQQVPDVEHLGHGGDPRVDLRRGPLAQLEREADVLEDGHVRVEGVVLEHHRHPPLVGRHPGDVPVAEEDRPGVGSSRPATRFSVVLLPQPDGPSSVTNAPSGTSRSRSSTARTLP